MIMHPAAEQGIPRIDDFPAFLAERDAATEELPEWTAGLVVTDYSVSLHRWGVDGAGGRVLAMVIGNGRGWHYRLWTEQGNPMDWQGSASTAVAAMRAALPFNHTALHP